MLKRTGAKEVITFTHRIRCFASDGEKLANNRSPAHSVHMDFTAAGAKQHLQAIMQDSVNVDEALQGRVMVKKCMASAANSQTRPSFDL